MRKLGLIGIVAVIFILAYVTSRPSFGDYLRSIVVRNDVRSKSIDSKTTENKEDGNNNGILDKLIDDKDALMSKVIEDISKSNVVVWREGYIGRHAEQKGIYAQYVYQTDIKKLNVIVTRQDLGVEYEVSKAELNVDRGEIIGDSLAVKLLELYKDNINGKTVLEFTDSNLVKIVESKIKSIVTMDKEKICYLDDGSITLRENGDIRYIDVSKLRDDEYITLFITFDKKEK